MSPGSDEAFFSIVGVSHTRNLRNGPVQCIATTLPVPYMENHMLLLKIHKQMKFSGVTEQNLKNSQFIYILTVLFDEITHI